ncbi:MAG: mechanosensitive ion channel family protein [Pseudomonadota bacterium]|nr:mechanosensitive ion channel family protein [Pseudomonadota bacterium]
MTVPGWASAVLTAAVLTGLFVLARRLLARQVRRLAGQTASDLDDRAADLIDRTHPVTLVAAALQVAAGIWLAGERLQGWVATAFTIVMFVQVGVWVGYLVEAVAVRRRASAVASGHPGDATAWTALAFVARVVVWAMVSLVALDTLGIDVTALVAGLGIGGLAVGLALQNVLGDVFASLAIVLDRPFVIGDFLVVDDVMGTVEHVGLKTTRVRALSGEQIVLSNADLLQSRIRNYQRLEERRVVLSFGVLYETSAELLARIPVLAGELVAEQSKTRFDRAHLCRFGDSSVDFELVYYLADRDYNRHMDVQQAILIGLFRRFGELGIGFAYPTRTIHVRWPADPLAHRTTLNPSQSPSPRPEGRPDAIAVE